MNLLSLLTNHRHYWGVPHERPEDNRMILTCYECGAEHVIKVDLRPYRLPQDIEFKHRHLEAARPDSHVNAFPTGQAQLGRHDVKAA